MGTFSRPKATRENWGERLRRLDRPILMLVTEPGPRLVNVVSAAVDGGVDVVQWRDKTSTVDDLLRLVAPELLPVIRDHADVVANFESPPISAMVRMFSNGIIGIHFPESEAYGRYHWGMFETDGRVIASSDSRDQAGGTNGWSIHSVENAVRAEKAGANYIVAGTIFASQSHPGTQPSGLDFLADVCHAVSIPVIAIGGITPANASACLRVGAAGVAVLSSIMHADDPRDAALTYRYALDHAVDRP